jgi:hypothetical protein
MRSRVLHDARRFTAETSMPVKEKIEMIYFFGQEEEVHRGGKISHKI